MEEIIRIAKDDREADVYVLSSLAALSSMMNNVVFWSDRHWYYPTHMVIVTGGPASGKSAAEVGRYLVKQLNEEKQLLSRKEYNDLVQEGAPQERLKLIKKLTHMLPANSTSAALVKSLKDNDGCGLMMSTEIDTMTNSFRSEYGDYSTILRMAFEHQTIEINRVSEPLIQTIEKPRFSVVLAGTPEQVTRLIPFADNGLFSRFLYYILPPDYEYRVNLFGDKSGQQRLSDEERFEAIGDWFYSQWLRAREMNRIEISFKKCLF